MIYIVHKNKVPTIPNSVTVVIMRPTIFGNSFEIGRDGTRNEVCDKYAIKCIDSYRNDVCYRDAILRLVHLHKAGTNIILKCCCVPQRCHGISIKQLIEDIAMNPLKYTISDVTKAELFNEYDRDIANSIIENSATYMITVLSQKDAEYPSILDCDDKKPRFLFCKGDVSLLKSDCVAVVGTRKTTIGKALARKIGCELSKNGFTVVSGLALGIDTAGHEGALDNRGKTIAILAHGLHMIYPKTNTELADRILQQGGLLVSEYPPLDILEIWKLIQRNRIQSGLSLCSVIVECGEKSGTMGHVKFALKQGKPIFVAIPDKENHLFKSFNYTGGEYIIENKWGKPFTSVANLLDDVRAAINK